MKVLFSILTLSLSLGVFTPAYGFEDLESFDSADETRFDRVNVPVGNIQTAHDLAAPTIKKKYFDKTIAIGLSPNEMKNLNVESGQLLEIQAGDRDVVASVYRVTGSASPPHATINLSPAAAAKLQVKSGDIVVVHHMSDESVPEITTKPTVINFSTRVNTQQSGL